MFYAKIDASQYQKADNNNLNIFGIFGDLVVQLIFRNDGVEIPSKDGQDSVPTTGSNGGEQNEFAIIHLG